ncbi:endoglucanase type F [Fusarium coicis]|nr:endoglucanase type F [Fusarium coicis]
MRVSTISAIFTGLAVMTTQSRISTVLSGMLFSRSPRASVAFPTFLLPEVWEPYEKTYDGGVDANVNTGFHQIMANKGYLNICVRWDSSASITAAERTKIASAYNAQYQKWFKWLYGYNGFPYDEVEVNVVAYAVKDKSQLQGSTDGYELYTELDADGVPMCPVACARDAHLDGDYSNCEAGADRHYDHSLWLKDGLEGGFGHDWGQEVGLYDWTHTGITKFIMLAVASMEIIDFDGWMSRNWWYYLSQKNNWSSSKSSTNTVPASSESKPTTNTAAPTTKTTTPKPSTISTNAIAANPASSKKATATKAPVTQVTSAENAASAEVAVWGQCGCNNWTGATKRASGAKCIKQNDYYSQCVAN